MVIVDPMHNLFLGTAHHFWKHLLEKKLVRNLTKIDDQLSETRSYCPQDMGRIPQDITNIKMVPSFTADQWKNWTISFSVPFMTGNVDQKYLQVWKSFVAGSMLLCSRVLSRGDALRADGYLHDFCIQAEELLGKDFVTPNMHLHNHLLECINDFGPVYSFWLFSFERYNGILGDFTTNNKNIEAELMKKFLILNYSFNLELEEEEESFLASIKEPQVQGSLQIEEVDIDVFEVYGNSFSPEDPPRGDEKYGNPVGPLQLTTLPQIIRSRLLKYYEQLPDLRNQNINFSPVIRKFSNYAIGPELFTSSESRTERSSNVLTIWNVTTGNVAEVNSNIFPGKILFFFTHKVRVGDQTKEFTFAYLKYFAKSPTSQGRNVSWAFDPEIFRNEWKQDTFYQEADDCIVPVQRIICRFVPAIIKPGIFAICPLHRKIIF